jgi:N-acetylmuramoyl-L-alanine amidase
MLDIVEQLLPYHDRLKTRKPENLQLVVLHCTELPTLEQAREFGEKVVLEDGTGHSGHYCLDRDGRVYRYVKDDRIAHHVVGHNDESIGIELVNRGRYPNWFYSNKQMFEEQYTAEQIFALKELLSDLRRKYPGIFRIARHSDLDTRLIAAEDNSGKQVRRRLDPGPLFPWDEIQKWWNSREAG